MARLFGTDGIRGRAGSELTSDLAWKVGKALGNILKEDNDDKYVLIATDTRYSRNMLKESITKGLNDMGINVIDAGILPTPAVCYLVSNNHYDAGIMITASHNTYEYNGIKIFDGQGYKLDDQKEDKIEEIVKNINSYPDEKQKGNIEINENLLDEYINYLLTVKQEDYSSFNIVIDTANGSASVSALKLFTMAGCNVEVINSKYDGYNINKECGSTHLTRVINYVKKNNKDVGFAFDGDADRCIVIDNEGNIIDGDYLLIILGNYLKQSNELKKNTIVGTVMSNIGLIKALEENNINFVKTKVGDRYVLEEMLRNDYSLGGEQSGHIIYRKYAKTGDGQLTALCLLNALSSSGKTLNELATIMKKYPQVMINVEVSNKHKEEYKTNDTLQECIQEIETKLGNSGRVLVRASGTEPLIRVMIEGENEETINNYAKYLADKVKELIG